MNPLEALAHEKLEVLECPGKNGHGNYVLRIEREDGPRILKLYRPRWPRWQELTESLLARTILGRSPGETWARYRSELEGLRRWREAGFDVPRIIEEPLPAGIEPPGLWIEFCSGRLLLHICQDDTVSRSEKLALIERLGGELGRRHRLARESGEVRLVHKHGTLEHVLLGGERLVTLDLEGNYLPGFAIREALARELSGFLRSTAKNSGDAVDEAFERFARGYSHRDLLREIADWGVHGQSFTRWLSRRSDRRKRATHGKTEVLARLLRLLGTG